MNLYIGIVIAVIGLLLAVLGFSNFLSNMGGSGILLVLSAGLIIGLSFIPDPNSESDNTKPMPVFERLIKMFFAPAEVFSSFRTNPKWLIAILVTAIFSATYTTAFFHRLTPEKITTHTTEKLSESGFLDEKQLAVVKQQNIEINSSPIKPLGDFINSFVGFSFGAALLGLIFFLGILVFGGQIHYLQALSVAAYSMFPVTVVQKILSMIILFLKEPTEIHPIIGQSTLVIDNLSFLVSAGSNPVLYTLLTSISLLTLYWVWLMSLGLRKAGEKVGVATSWAIPIFIWLLLLTLGIIVAFFFGSFIS